MTLVKIIFFSLIFCTQSFAQDPKEVIQNSFSERLKLRETATIENASAVKKQINDMRNSEALQAEQLAGNQNIGLRDKSTRAFDSTSLLNPAFSQLEFKKGDLIVLRGTSIISNTIATLSDSVTPFSHLVMVAEDPVTKQLLAVESLVEKNTIVHPLEDVLTEGVPRMVLYRHADPELAARAAQKAYEAALKNIPYDYSPNIDRNYDALYCFELATMAYDLASNGKVIIPSFPSTVGGKFPKTIASLKINFQTRKVFSPADMDVEKFSLVAEWSDPKATLNYRIKDQVLLKLFQWIEEDSVIFDYSKLIPAKKPGDKKTDLAKLKEFAAKAEQVVNALTEQILLTNSAHVKNTGMNMSADEIQTYIESVRNDSKLIQLFKKNQFILKPCPPALNKILK